MLVGFIFLGAADLITDFFHIGKIRVKICLCYDQRMFICQCTFRQIFQNLTFQAFS